MSYQFRQTAESFQWIEHRSNFPLAAAEDSLSGTGSRGGISVIKHFVNNLKTAVFALLRLTSRGDPSYCGGAECRRKGTSLSCRGQIYSESLNNKMTKSSNITVR